MCRADDWTAEVNQQELVVASQDENRDWVVKTKAA